MTAVDDVSFDVRAGSITGLIGPNGAGKTTLLDAVSGFVDAGGEVVLGGDGLQGQRTDARARRGLGRTFQSIELYDDLTVLENIAVGRAAATDREGELPAGALTEMLDVLGLAPLAERPAGELSQGTRQLVSIARALAGNPSVLLLDEPAAGLDSTESRWLGARLRRLRDRGVAILLVDHDLQLVLDLCDEVQVLDFGRLIASGPPRGRAQERAGQEGLHRQRGHEPRPGRRRRRRGRGGAAVSTLVDTDGPALPVGRGRPRRRGVRAGRGPRGRSRAGARPRRPERRRQDDPAADAGRAAPAARRRGDRGRRSPPRRQPPVGLEGRDRARARRPVAVPRADRGREPRGRPPAPRARRPGDARPLPRPRAALEAGRRQPLGRRAADARRRPGADAAPVRPADRRAEHGPRARRRRGRPPGGAPHRRRARSRRGARRAARPARPRSRRRRPRARARGGGAPRERRRARRRPEPTRGGVPRDARPTKETDQCNPPFVGGRAGGRSRSCW